MILARLETVGAGGKLSLSAVSHQLRRVGESKGQEMASANTSVAEKFRIALSSQHSLYPSIRCAYV